MRSRIDKLGGVGLVLDTSASELPPNALSSMQNIRCDNGRISNAGGVTTIKDITTGGDAGASDRALHLGVLQTATTQYYVYANDTNNDGGAEKLYSFDGTNITDETDAAVTFTGTSPDIWQHENFAGWIIMNNGVDGPQVWDGSAAAFVTMDYDASNDWDNYDGSGAGSEKEYRAKIIRGYRQYLFAFDITDNNTRYPHLAHWSDAATGQALPASWDYDDTTTDSARTDEFAGTPGYFVDALVLRDTLIVYKEDSIWTVRYIGGQYIHDVRIVTEEAGLYARNCVVDIGGLHICLGRDDVYAFDGSSLPKTIVEDRVREAIFADIDPTYADLTYLVHNSDQREVWICYCSSGNAIPNAAWVYKYPDGVWSKRDLPGCFHIVRGLESGTNDTWDSITGTWAEQTKQWGTRQYDPTATTLIGAYADPLIGGDAELVQVNDGNQALGVNMSCYAIRTDLRLGDSDQWNEVQEVRPQMDGGPVYFRIGSQDTNEGAVTWSDSIAFDPSTDYKFDVLVNGRRHAWQVWSNANVSWSLDSLEFSYAPGGED